jgi:hypothetical protein
MTQISNTATYRARVMSAVALAIAVVVAMVNQFGLHEGGVLLLVPILAAGAATIWPVRDVVAVMMVVTAGIVVTGRDDSNVLFASSLVTLMLALNHLQSAATKIRRSQKSVAQ